MKGDIEKLKQIYVHIQEWQNNPYVHPLTCGNDSQNHSELMPQLFFDGKEFELLLACRDCNYKQDIPEMFRK